jgi:hypothetical protein
MRSQKVLFRAAVLFGILFLIGGVILSFEQPASSIRAKRLQAQVDEELPDGISETEVLHWCQSHGFGVPVRQEEAPLTWSRITAVAPPTRPDWTTCLAIDFYFDADSKLRRRVVFKHQCN